MDILKILSGLYCFKHSNKNEISLVARTFHPVHFSRGQQVIKEGDVVRRIGLVADGELQIMMPVSVMDMKECGILGKGDFFGCGALMAGKKSVVSVYSKTTVKCFTQSEKDFFMMLKMNSRVKEFFYRTALIDMIGTFEKMNGKRNTGPDKFDKYSTGDETNFFPRTIRKALIYIEKNFMNPLSLDEVANINAMSRYHFSRIFKVKTGFTFKDYINTKRIHRAKYLMKYEDMNITEAAFAVGYNDLSYFSRLFQKHEGLSPSQYKKTIPRHSGK